VARLFLSSVSLFDPKARFFVPTGASLTSARAGAVKVGRRANLAACSAVARPHLVWALHCQAVSERRSLFLAFLIGFFVRSGIPFLRPDPHIVEAVARKRLSRPAVALTYPPNSDVSRLCLDNPEHGGTLVVVGMTASEGSSLSGHEELVPQPCIRWVAVTRTMMHACASAARLRGGGPILNSGTKAMVWHGTPPPRTVIASPSRTSGRERSHNWGRHNQHLSSIRQRDAAAHLRARRRRARDAKARSAACAPAPRSTSCASMGHPRFAADTIRQAHCPSGT
jgi:hypothetical protein